MPQAPYIPEFITVHLGPPSSNAENVTLPFSDYIANVASSEIYPTWPENAIRANMYAQISFALNRIYTEYYRSRGYDFDITNSIAIDQSFVNGRDIFSNINEIALELFDNYIVRQGSVEPLFAQYCDGEEVICDGLSQWGSVSLAQQGYTPYEILTYYYGNDINIVSDARIMGVRESYPGYPLRIGNVSDDVRIIQIRLNRISDNFSAIPKIPSPLGIFSFDTEDAVKRFQESFGLTPDGIIGKATWYEIQKIYASVKRLNDINSEGISLSEISKQFPEILHLGDTGIGVSSLQYYLAYISQFYNTVSTPAIDGIFGQGTLDSVLSAQNTFGLTSDGIVGPRTWNAIYNAYLGIVNTIPVKYMEGNAIPFPGVFLRRGVESEDVRVLQEYIRFISESYPEIPSVSPTGYFGYQTENSVKALQRLFGMEDNGIVGPLTWLRIAELYSDLYNGTRLNEGQYVGFSPEL